MFPDVTTLNAWAGDWSIFMIAALWQSTLLAATAGLVTALLRCASPAVRCWLWQIVAAKLLLMPLFVLSVPLAWLPELGDTPQEVGTAPAAIATALSDAPVDRTTPTSSERPLPIDPHQPTSPIEPAPTANQLSWTAWLMFAWALIVVGEFVLLLWQRTRLGRLLTRTQPAGKALESLVAECAARVGLARRPRVLVVDEDYSPFVCGVWRPAVVLPRSLEGLLSEGQLAPVLVHELAHVKRRDLWWNWIPEVARMLYFFHPIAQYVAFRVRLESELACDAWAMAATEQAPGGYANLLLRVVTRLSEPAMLRSSLSTFWKRRMAMLPFAKHAGQRLPRRTRTVLAVLAALTFAAPTLYLSYVPAAPPDDIAPAGSTGGEASAVSGGEPGQELPSQLVPVPDRPNVFRVLPAADGWPAVAFARVAQAPLRLQGSLALDANRLVRIHARIAGEIVAIGTIRDENFAGPQRVERALRLGDRVTKGQVLAVAWCKEVGDKKSDLLAALSKLYFDESQRKESQLKAFKSNEATALQKRLEADRQRESDAIEVARIERALRSWRLSEDEIKAVRAKAEKIHRGELAADAAIDKSWAEIKVSCPIDGVVLEKNVVAGDMVDTNVDLFKIADLSKLGVHASVFEGDVAALKALSPGRRRWLIDLKTQRHSPPIAGSFQSVGDVIDPNNHTASVIGSVNNDGGTLRAGQFITATIVDLPAPGSLVTVPSNALVKEGDVPAICVESDAEKQEFTWRRVHVVDKTAGLIFIQAKPSDDQGRRGAEPLRVGERVVCRAEAQAPEAPAGEATLLADAVKAFNLEAAKDPVGKNQPPLTEDEVVAAIQGWIRNRVPASDEVYDAYQRIAETRKLPPCAKLDFTTGWQTETTYFDVWWVDLSIYTGEKTGYTYRLRDQKIRSRPLTAEERQQVEQEILKSNED